MTNARRSAEGAAFFIAFAACIPLANWLIGHVGTSCIPGGPCLIPVAPGIMAPSGVAMIGLALVLRDLLQRRLGLGWSMAAIATGTAVSALVAPPALVIASAAAFLLSESADMAIYTPLQRRGLVLAPYPALRAYAARVRARPAALAAHPEGWPAERCSRPNLFARLAVLEAVVQR